MTKNDLPDIISPIISATRPHSKSRVSYYYNHEVSKFHFQENHPMKPPRLALTNDLIVNYNLVSDMDVFWSMRATDEEIARFHSRDYLQFLKTVTPENKSDFAHLFSRFNVGIEDCPVFSGMYEFCKYSCGGSLAAARRLANDSADVAINWSGGLHHAKKWEASGFCYTNDIVLAILELLRKYARVLYIDIDVHHGDGVQEAFYNTDRVMTVSFHRYDGLFFPQTGAVNEIGVDQGKYYSLNVPLQEAIDDKSYYYIFTSIMADVLKVYQPSAIALQCGADSLAGDRLGDFNLSFKGHGSCVEYIASQGIPMIVLGGGGYTIRNVSRLWAYETSVCCGYSYEGNASSKPFVDNSIPDSCRYYRHFGPDFMLHAPIVDDSAVNKNSKPYLDAIRIQVSEYLRYIQAAPSVQMQEIPPSVSELLLDPTGKYEQKYPNSLASVVEDAFDSDCSVDRHMDLHKDDPNIDNTSNWKKALQRKSKELQTINEAEYV